MNGYAMEVCLNKQPCEFLYSVLYTEKNSPLFYFHPLAWVRIQNWANRIIYKGLCKESKG